MSQTILPTDQFESLRMLYRNCVVLINFARHRGLSRTMRDRIADVAIEVRYLKEVQHKPGYELLDKPEKD